MRRRGFVIALMVVLSFVVHAAPAWAIDEIRVSGIEASNDLHGDVINLFFPFQTPQGNFGFENSTRIWIDDGLGDIFVYGVTRFGNSGIIQWNRWAGGPHPEADIVANGDWQDITGLVRAGMGGSADLMTFSFRAMSDAVSSVVEPATLGIFAAGLGLLAAVRRHRKPVTA